MAAHHLIELTPDWGLWRDFAVRSAGFPVEGLRVFGGEGESERLAEVARDPAFREAVAWQSRESLASAVDKHAAGVKDSPSRIRRREEIVARYWQRYCAKNDTIGFFGPLAWGRFGDDGFAARAGSAEHERVVHFENWAVEAVAARAGVAPLVPMDPFPERALRSGSRARRRRRSPRSIGSRPRAPRPPRRRATASAPRSPSSTASSRTSRGVRRRAATATVAAGGRSSTSTACASST
jgi:Lantibiotic dehydratase, N terminus